MDNILKPKSEHIGEVDLRQILDVVKKQWGGIMIEEQQVFKNIETTSTDEEDMLLLDLYDGSTIVVNLAQLFDEHQHIDRVIASVRGNISTALQEKGILKPKPILNPDSIRYSS